MELINRNPHRMKDSTGKPDVLTLKTDFRMLFGCRHMEGISDGVGLFNRWQQVLKDKKTIDNLLLKEI